MLIAVGDYVISKAKKIKDITKKWELSFSAIQRAMLQNKEHSVRGRQYAKWKRATEEQEEPTKKSQWPKKKGMAKTTKVKEDKQEAAKKVKPDQESTEESQGDKLPDVPWTKAWKKMKAERRPKEYWPRNVPA